MPSIWIAILTCFFGLEWEWRYANSLSPMFQLIGRKWMSLSALYVNRYVFLPLRAYHKGSETARLGDHKREDFQFRNACLQIEKSFRWSGGRGTLLTIERILCVDLTAARDSSYAKYRAFPSDC